MAWGRERDKMNRLGIIHPTSSWEIPSDEQIEREMTRETAVVRIDSQNQRKAAETQESKKEEERRKKEEETPKEESKEDCKEDEETPSKHVAKKKKERKPVVPILEHLEKMGGELDSKMKPQIEKKRESQNKEKRDQTPLNHPKTPSPLKKEKESSKSSQKQTNSLRTVTSASETPIQFIKMEISKNIKRKASERPNINQELL